MLTYILRDIDPALWHAVKVRAAEQGLTIRAVILAQLAQWCARRRSRPASEPAGVVYMNS
jgi:hypothetical protein